MSQPSQTIRVQQAEEAALIELCRQEGRAIVTLDLDFANPLRFKPSHFSGIAVLRLPSATTTISAALSRAWINFAGG